MADDDRIGELKAQGKTAAEIGAALGLSTDQVRRRWGRWPSAARPVLGGEAKDQEIVRLRDRVRRLENELVSQHRANIEQGDINEVVRRINEARINPPDWLVTPQPRHSESTAQVLMTSWSDWHAGERVSRDEVAGFKEYSIEIMEQRVRRLIERAVSIAKEHGPEHIAGAVVNILGDMVSGGLHPELAKTDEEEVIPAALRVVELLSWGLTTIADAFGRVYVPCVAGNHGRGTSKPEFKRYLYKSFDWLIYRILVREFESRGDCRIRFDIRPANETLYQVYGLRFLAMHGDMLGVKGGDGIIGSIGPIVRGDIKVRGYAAGIGGQYDILLLGHWHRELWLPNVFVSNTLKGYDEYAKNALRAPPEAPTQPLWFVHPKHGITSRWTIKVEEPAELGAQWLQVFDPAVAA